jgi:hypothetical protein
LSFHLTKYKRFNPHKTDKTKKEEKKWHQRRR